MKLQDKTRQLVFFDFEMKCIKGKAPFKKMEAICIGACKFEITTKQVHFFHSYIKPKGDTKLTRFCKELTGIKQIDIDKAPSFSEVFERFFKWVANTETTEFLSWGENDLKRFQIDAKENGFSESLVRKVTENYTDFQGVFKGNLTGDQKSVENALKLYNQKFEGKVHNPTYDSYNTLRVFLNYQNHYYVNQAIILNEKFFKKQSDTVKSKFEKYYSLFYEWDKNKGNFLSRRDSYHPSFFLEKCKYELESTVKQALQIEIEEVMQELEEERGFNKIVKTMKKIRSIEKKYLKLKNIKLDIFDYVTLDEEHEKLQNIIQTLSNEIQLFYHNYPSETCEEII